jgi:hypothetical protein
MKTITLILMLFLFSNTYSQLVVDSTGVEKVSETEDWFWCRAHYEGTIPSVSDYIVGFLYGEDRDNISYIPMGWYNHDAGTKTITYRTEMGNLPKSRIWVQGYILPKSNVSKYEIGGLIYLNNGKYWYYDIFQEPYLEVDLPLSINGTVGETVTFTVYATGQNLEYEWYRRTMNPDTTWNEPVKINGEITNEYTTPSLQAQYDGWKVFCRIYNSIGEVYSRQCLLKVY